MHPKYLKKDDYTYDLPVGKIAGHPLAQRDASKLLVYSPAGLVEDTYAHIAAYIPAGALMVFNRTKVIHARLLFRKPTGAAIEVFCLEPADIYADIATAMTQKNKVLWICLVGGAAKWPDGVVLQLSHTSPQFVLSAAIKSKLPGGFLLELSWNGNYTFAEILHHAGQVPLPPYLHRAADAADEDRYQTIFARDEGSVAAPTAGLHFTDQVMQRIADKGIHTSFVTLHVGAGTFKPIDNHETIAGHTMHAEWIEVTQAAIQQVLEHPGSIVAVGTTSLRTLESLYWIGCRLLAGDSIHDGGIAVDQWEPYEKDTAVPTHAALQAVLDWLQRENLPKLVCRTRIMIAPGYTFRVVKGLVTNFHQPGSTLLLLVAALIGPRWRQVYDYALSHDYRFLSYGDGCLLWHQPA